MRDTLRRRLWAVLEECDEVARPRDSTHGILEPGAGLARFSLERLAPAPDLEPWIARHWIVRWELPPGEEFVQAILPHPCVNLVSEPGLIAVHGIPLARSHHRLSGSALAVGTKFRPGAFAPFTGRPASELNGRSAGLGEVFGEPGTRLDFELAARAGDPAAHIEAVEAFLLERLPPPDPRYELVRAVAEDMLRSPVRTTVAKLAERHGITPRTLQRAFRDYVGVGPKWVLKRYRVHEAAERIAAGADDLAALAFELGYSDQSHFTREFTAQVGRPPLAYARACAAAAGRALADTIPGR